MDDDDSISCSVSSGLDGLVRLLSCPGRPGIFVESSSTTMTDDDDWSDDEIGIIGEISVEASTAAVGTKTFLLLLLVPVLVLVVSEPC